jgi:hypothetical protein
MKKMFLALTLALLFALAVGIGVANAAPPNDFAVGGGKHTDPANPNVAIQFAFSAQSGPLGEDPKGQIQLDFDGNKIKAEVTCLIVVGNEAFITGVSDELPGGIVVTHAVDNGEPSDGTPDLLRNSFQGAIVEDPANPGCFLPTGSSASALPYGLIHRSAWNRISAKFTCRILHNPAPFAPGSPRLAPSTPSLEERALIQR